MSKEFKSFEEFWPFYVNEHRNKLNRILHFIGTTCALSFAARALLKRRPWLLFAAPIAGYSFAWIGHFFIERNKPASFQHPLWSLRGDFRMWQKMLMRQMEKEVEKYSQEENDPIQEEIELPREQIRIDPGLLN